MFFRKTFSRFDAWLQVWFFYIVVVRHHNDMTNPNPSQRQLVHEFVNWGIVEQRLQRFPAIGRAFAMKYLRSHQDTPPYYCHYMAWRLGTWNSESLFARLVELLDESLSRWKMPQRFSMPSSHTVHTVLGAKPFIPLLRDALVEHRLVEFADYPIVAYFTGKLEIVTVETVLGEVRAQHRPAFTSGGPSGV